MLKINKFFFLEIFLPIDIWILIKKVKISKRKSKISVFAFPVYCKIRLLSKYLTLDKITLDKAGFNQIQE